METKDYFNFIVNNIHSTVAATVDDKGLPITCAMDIMDYDDNGLYFLTAKGKNIYNRLINQRYLSLTGIKGESTMSCVSVSVRGKVRELGSEKVSELFNKNPYMYEIYPDESSRSAISVFQIYEGSGEWFDLSKKPVERASFAFGGEEKINYGYYVTDKCTGCKLCCSKCPQKCIDIREKPAIIRQTNCLHCGNCFEICPTKAIIKKV